MLIAIDGVDSSGKETQASMLYEYLAKSGRAVRLVSFPNYSSVSSTFVKMYLEGTLGKNANDIDPYAVSTFFAADRYLSFHMDWKANLDAGEIIVADRYVTSNMIHQASKIEDGAKKMEFVDWLEKFEYEIYGLPRPDMVLFLDMPVPYALSLLEKRIGKVHSDKEDIHEKDVSYLSDSYNNAVSIAKKFGWETVSCVKDGVVRAPEDISSDISKRVEKLLAGGDES